PEEVVFEAALLDALAAADEPVTRYLMVVHGARRISSWSWPIMFAPLRARQPTMRKLTFWTRMSLPTGDSPANNSRTSVWPMRQTLLEFLTSRSVNGSP